MKVATLFAACVALEPAIAQQPIPFRLDDNLVHVAAAIDGVPVDGVLDSGTGGLVLDRLAADRLRIPYGAASGSAAGGGAGTQSLFPITVGSVQLGDVRLSNVAGFALDLKDLARSAGFGIDALLGAPFFAGRVVTIDYPGRVVTFAVAAAAPGCADPIPVTVVHGVPVAEVTLRIGPDTPPAILHLVVDLGTRHFAAIVGGPFVDSAGGRTLSRSGVRKRIGTGTGGTIAGTEVRVAALELGHHRYPDLPIALTREVRAFEMGSVDGSLGVPLWAASVVTFDDLQHTLCIEAPAAGLRMNPEGAGTRP